MIQLLVLGWHAPEKFRDAMTENDGTVENAEFEEELKAMQEEEKKR